MSDTTKPGKRRYRDVKRKPRNLEQADAVYCRHNYGSTERILRRNRKVWERLYAKIGRQIDKEEIVTGLFDYILNRRIVNDRVIIEY